MNSKGFWRRGWLTQVMAFVILLVGVVAAHAGSIDGTVTNSTTRAGRVFISLQHEYGGDTGLGVSVSPLSLSWPDFTIRGVPNGTYRLNAFVDGSATGFIHANDPTWSSTGTITINNDTYSGTESDVTFTKRPNVAPVTPQMVMILPGDNGAFVGWDEPEDSNFNIIADSYKVYWSTGSNATPKATPEGVITVPAGEQAFAVLDSANGTTIHVQVTSLVGTTESAESSVYSMPISPPATGYSVTGTINLSGFSNPTGTLYLAVVDPTADGPPTAVATVDSPPQLSNNFTIHGVPDGTYSLYAMIDMDGDGKIGSGDIMASEQQSSSITVGGADITLGSPITLTQTNSFPFLNTSHYQDSSDPPYDGYQLVIGAWSETEVPVNITVTNGPTDNGLSYPIDLGINSWGQFQAWLNVGNNRPVVAPTPDTYNLDIQYANGVGSDAVNLPVTAVLDSFATPTAPVGNLPWSLVANPTVFSWDAPTGPAPLPDPYTYSFWVNAPGFDNNNNAYYQMPSSTSSLSITGLNYSDGTRYDWGLTVEDAYGNQAQKSAWFVYTSGPAIDSFTPTTVLPGMTVTISGINFSTTAANNTVNFCGASATASTVNASGTELTVVVPSNTCSGSIQVNDTGTGKTSQPSMTQLNVLQTMMVSGQVTGIDTSSGIIGATVTATFTVNFSTLTRTVTTDTNGNYIFDPNSPTPNGIPMNTDFTLSFSADGYASAYSGTLNNTNSYSVALYPMATFNTWNGGDATTGVIRGQVYNSANSSSLAGVTINSSTGTVMYDDGNGNPVAGASTGDNGVFYITHVLNSATVTATKAGYLINPVTAVGYAGSVTGVTMSASPIISVSGTVVNSTSAPLAGATVGLLGTSNETTSAANGAFTFDSIPGSPGFEMKMSLDPTYVPTYSGWLNSPTNLTLPFPYVLFTQEELTGVLGISAGKGAIIGRVVNSANPSAAISGATVTIYGPHSTVLYFNSATGLFSPTAGTDASGLFLVKDVEEGYNLGVNASVGTLINGNVNVTTHANAVSQIAVPSNVPPVSFGWTSPPSPSAITVTATSQTPSIYGQVTVLNVTTAGPGPTPGLVAELGYGPQGTDPSNPVSGWVWKTAAYSTQQGGNHEYVTNLSVPTAGSYDYAYRFSYFGGQYVYGDLTGSNDGYSSDNAGKLTVNTAIPTTTTLVSNSNPSVYGQEVGFTVTVSPSEATGTVQLYVDGNLVASTNVNGGSATFGPITDITVGSHTVTATYSGDSSYDISTSAGLSQTVEDGIKINISTGTGNFLTLQAAIDATLDTDTLLIRDKHFKENLTVDYTTLLRPSPTPFTITLKGGLGSDFSTTAVTASSARKLTIKHGKVIANRFVVKPD